MALLLDAMSAPWAAHIYGPSPQPTHLASANPADRRVFCPAADGQLPHAYTASSTAALLPLGQPAQPMEAQDLPANLRPVLVIEWGHCIPATQPPSIRCQLWAPTLLVPGQMALWTPGLDPMQHRHSGSG